jgi:hypothetical protein
MPDDLPETRFRRHVTRRLKCAFSPQRQSRAHPVDGHRASTAPRSPNAASDRASRSFTIAQTRFSAKSRKVVARRTVVARAVAETEAETKAEKPKRKFSPKKNVTVQDADIAVGNKYEGKVVRHPSFTRLLYHPDRAASGCERGKCDRGARGGSAPGAGTACFVSWSTPAQTLRPQVCFSSEAFPIQTTSRGRAGGGPMDVTSRRYRRDTPDEPLDAARRHPARQPVTHRASAPDGDKSTPRQPPPVSDKKQFGISL